MVYISTYAVALIEEDRLRKGIPPSQRVRISAGDRPGGPSIRMAYVDSPQSGDRTLEEHGAEFYLAPDVTQPLKGVTVDAVDLDPPQLVFRRNQPSEVLLSRDAPEAGQTSEELT